MADWLSQPIVAGQLWPADIHAQVVHWLGGSVVPNAAGQPEIRLSVLSVLWRLLVFSTVCFGVGRLVFSARPAWSTASILLRRIGGTGLAAGILWLAELFFPTVLLQGLLSPLIMMLVGWALSGGLSVCLPESPIRDDARPRRKLIALISLSVIALAWTAVSFLLNERLYALLLIPHGDSAMYEEHLWNLWHGKGFRSYLDQGLFLGEHIQVIHLLLLPLHMLWPSHLALELSESLALAACTIPLFLMTWRRTGDGTASVLVGVAWLLYFPMHFLDIAIDQKTFRPICLGLPFLLWMIHAAETGRYRTAWFCLLIALSAKEDMALTAAPLTAVMAAVDGRNESENRRLRAWGLTAAAGCALWLILAVFVVIPAFRSGHAVHYSRYFGDLGSSPGELLQTALTSPGRVLNQLLRVRTLLYAVLFLAPLSFVPLKKPLILLAGLPTFLMLSLIQLGDGPESGGLPPVPFHHFHAPLLPVLFWAAAGGVAAFQKETGGVVVRFLPGSARQAALLIACCSFTTGLTGSLHPAGATFWSDTSPFGRHRLYFPRAGVEGEQQLIDRAAMAERVVEQIPLTARVASTDFIHTRLTHCERSYDYSDYPRAVNEPGKRVPADCEFIVIDTGHRYSTIRSPDEVPELTESTDWILLPDTTAGWFLILERVRSTP